MLYLIAQAITYDLSSASVSFLDFFLSRSTCGIPHAFKDDIITDFSVELSCLPH